MASVLGLLEVREVSAQERVDGLRVEIDRLVAELASAEVELERLAVARQMVSEVLAGADEDESAEMAGVGAVPGAVVPKWRQGLTAAALAPDYQRILAELQERPEGVRVRELAVALGLAAVPAKIEGVRSKARRLVERGWAVQLSPGVFSPSVSTAG